MFPLRTCHHCLREISASKMVKSCEVCPPCALQSTSYTYRKKTPHTHLTIAVPPFLNSGISPRTRLLSQCSLFGNVVASTQGRLRVSGEAPWTNPYTSSRVWFRLKRAGSLVPSGSWIRSDSVGWEPLTPGPEPAEVEGAN